MPKILRYSCYQRDTFYLRDSYLNKRGFPRRRSEPIRLRSEPALAPPQVNIVEGVNCAEESIRIVNGVRCLMLDA